ncbi:hypothetical protein HU200_046950 [Digitaria exilis]|uniref:Uncharacterized protein n=1 Tax=Digitaria exilis TaxID=1010633 RepID=A0A835B052_9POAL|nr:hypothetical protein HU200_046950 [Digitaria exilis]
MPFRPLAVSFLPLKAPDRHALLMPMAYTCAVVKRPPACIKLVSWTREIHLSPPPPPSPHPTRILPAIFISTRRAAPPSSTFSLLYKPNHGKGKPNRERETIHSLPLLPCTLQEQRAPTEPHLRKKQSNPLPFPPPIPHLRRPPAMARPARALLIPLLAVLALVAVARAAAGDVSVPGATAASLGWELGVVGAAEDDEFGFPGAADSVARRVLQQGPGYISYGALRRDNVPCSVRGASYYNCRPGAQANPYSRGCSAITRCRG